MLVRFTTGDFPRAANLSHDRRTSNPTPPPGIPRSSTSNSLKGIARKPSVRKLSKDDIVVGTAKPLSQLSQDALSGTSLNNSSISESPLEAPPRVFDGGRRGSTSSARSEVGSLLAAIAERPSGSPSGNMLSHSTTTAPLDSRPQQRQSAMPLPRVASRLPSASPSPSTTLSTSLSSPPEEKDSLRSRHKISAPQGGAPIPAGFKFGAKDDLPDRERKAKSGRWGFGFGKISKPVFQLHNGGVN